VSINFLARGSHLDAIKTNGLSIVKDEETIVVRPAQISDQTKDLGLQDYIFICTKGYDLEILVQQLAPCLKDDTVIIPLQNGVDSSARIKKILPDNIVCDGCVYVVSRITGPGTIRKTGIVEALYFGIDGITDKRLVQLEQLLMQAGIHATYAQDILAAVWEKFVFLAPIAIATSYYDKPIGEILANKEWKATVNTLVTEVVQLAGLENVRLANDIVAMTMDKIQALPFDATTSLHNDFKAGKAQNELESLGGHVVRRAGAAHLSVPLFEMLYEVLKDRRY